MKKTLLTAWTGALMAAGLAMNAGAQPTPPPPALAHNPPTAPSAVTVAADTSQDAVSSGTATTVLLKQQRDAMKQQREATVQAEKAMENAYNVLAKVHTGAPSQLERALVIRASKTDTKTIAAMEEDLRVMSRILHKALHVSGDDGQQRAMGISMMSTTDGGRARNIQIEGFGAIFLLTVHFPLVGPESKEEDTATKEPTNSTWEQAKREVYGHTSDPFTAPTLTAFTARPKYDAKRVEKLKDSLLEALKNASNIRYLTPDENVTVVVNSGGEAGWDDAVANYQVWEKVYAAQSESSASTGTDRAPSVHEFRSEHPTQATMTIRAKKSDIDAFAKGKLTPEEFRKKVSMLVY